MNPGIELLYKVGQKESRLIIGLMSGTSLDGLDVALCKFTGAGKATEVELLAFETVSFTEEVKSETRKVFAKQSVDFPHLCMLNPWLGNLHGEIVNDCLNRWNLDNGAVDAIASHGQTVMHQPQRLHKNVNFPNATLQIGDGDHLAVKTGIITISDFRQKHCAVGGEGAPLALYGDYLLFSSKEENRILINIGGIANYTFLPDDLDFDKVFATDTGPGNTLIDAYVLKHFQLPYDDNAAIAITGKCNKELLNILKSNPFFKEEIPKTTGPELFSLNYLASILERLEKEIVPEDVLNTLCHFTAETLAESIKSNVPLSSSTTVYLSGGGMHNPLICSLIGHELLGTPIKKMGELGISGDAKEAVLFAALANETLAGNSGFLSPGNKKGSFFMGKISFPE